MADRQQGLRDALRGDERRVGLAALAGSAGVGLVAFVTVGVASPAVVSVTPLSAAWPLAVAVGASTAAVVCTGRAVALGVPGRPTAIATGAAAATVAVLAPGLAVGLPLPAETGTALLGTLSVADVVGLAPALAVPAFALGAGVGLTLSTVGR